jgi:hypothetical protein
MRFLILPVALALAAPAHAGETYTGPPVLVTAGEAVLRVAPDRAVVQLTTEGRAPTAKPAQQQEADAATAVRAQLGKAGVPDAAVRTLAYELRQEFDYANGKQTPRGFVARQTIEVRVDDVGRLGEVIGRAVESGAAAVADVRFDVKARQDLERQALTQAVADARARADAAAAGAGTSVAGIIRIEEQRQPEFRPVMARGMAAEAAAVATPIATGEIEIRAGVSLTSALK